MGYFNSSQNKWIIVALVLLNLGFVAAMWWPKGEKHGRPGEGPPRHQTERLFKKELDLDEAQFEKVKILREQHFEEVQELLKQVRANKSEMFNALEGSNPDTSAANAFAKKSGALESQIDQLLIQHFMDLRAVCNEEQRQKLEKVFKRAIGKPGHGPGPKHPPKGDGHRPPPRDR